MHDKPVSIPNFWIGLVAFLIMSLIITVGYLVVQSYSVSVTHAHFARVAAELQSWQERTDQRAAELIARIEVMERDVYGTLPAETAELRAEQQKRPRLTNVERWQINRDRELRQRLEALEKWRLDTGGR